jgi:hypothetical protein
MSLHCENKKEINMNAPKRKFLSAVSVALLTVSLSGGIALAADEPGGDSDQKRSTAKDFLQLTVRPIAIGHH